jgi:Heparinase II/III-like protein
MTLALGLTELFIDRGTLTYTGPERNEFRATVSHNTLEIDGTSSVTPGEAFKWLPGIPARAHGMVCSSAHFSSFFGLAAGHVADGRPSAHCRRVLHFRGGAWVVHDRGLREGARRGVLRWQLAPYLTAAPLTAESVAILDGAGVGVATIFLRGASTARVLVRDVSLRHGHRIAAQCLELEVDASLEALTIIAPAGPNGSLVRFEADEQHGERGVVWTDTMGRHCVVAGPSLRIPQLLPGTGPDADLVWWVSGADTGGHDVQLIAALPAVAAHISADARDVTQLPDDSGKMGTLANTDGHWAAVAVEQPRRG